MPKIDAYIKSWITRSLKSICWKHARAKECYLKWTLFENAFEIASKAKFNSTVKDLAETRSLKNKRLSILMKTGGKVKQN